MSLRLFSVRNEKEGDSGTHTDIRRLRDVYLGDRHPVGDRHLQRGDS